MNFGTLYPGEYTENGYLLFKSIPFVGRSRHTNICNVFYVQAVKHLSRPSHIIGTPIAILGKIDISKKTINRSQKEKLIDFL